MRGFWFGCLVAVALGGCSPSDDTETPEVSKELAYSAKADTSVTARLCRELNEAPDCDLCEVKGWYGDGECDTFCKDADLDCSSQCQSDLDCLQPYCVVEPCPQNFCDAGQCVSAPVDPCFEAKSTEGGQCLGAGGTPISAECCECEGAEEPEGWPGLCINIHGVNVDIACCDDLPMQ